MTKTIAHYINSDRTTNDVFELLQDKSKEEQYDLVSQIMYFETDFKRIDWDSITREMYTNQKLTEIIIKEFKEYQEDIYEIIFNCNNLTKTYFKKYSNKFEFFSLYDKYSHVILKLFDDISEMLTYSMNPEKVFFENYEKIYKTFEDPNRVSYAELYSKIQIARDEYYDKNLIEIFKFVNLHMGLGGNISDKLDHFRKVYMTKYDDLTVQFFERYLNLDIREVVKNG